MRVLYEECEEMSKLEHALRASARGMEEWERRRRGEIVVGGGEGEDEDDGEWAEEENEDEEDVKRRKAGVRTGERERGIRGWCDYCAARDITVHKSWPSLTLCYVVCCLVLSYVALSIWCRSEVAAHIYNQRYILA